MSSKKTKERAYGERLLEMLVIVSLELTILDQELMIEIKRTTLKLSDLLIKAELNKINEDLKKLTEKHRDFYSPQGIRFLNESM